MKIHFFDSPVEKFIDSLERSTRAKIFRAIDLLEMFGNKLGLPQSKKVDSRLFELRARGKQEIRIFYTFHKDSAVLLHGFIKKSQHIPNRELATARQKLSLLD